MKSPAAGGLFILLMLCRVFALADSLYIAGSLNGRIFYWVNDNVALDTLGLPAITERLYGEADPKLTSLDSIRPLLEQRNLRLLRLNARPAISAISIAILHDLKYPILVLDQWSGRITTGQVTEVSPLDFKKGPIVSDYLWEQVEKVDVERPSGTNTEYTVRIHFHNAGYSQADGKDNLNLAGLQILGTRGFDLRHKHETWARHFVVDENLNRVILGIYIIADTEKKPKKIVSEIEGIMDRLKLDISYRAPTFKGVP